MTSLAGKRVLVTGAASGIGRAVAEAAAGAGARVALVDRQTTGLEATAAAIADAGGECLAHLADVTDEAALAGGFAAAAERWGGLDAVAGIAGIELDGTGDGPVDAVELEVWRRVIDVNLTGMFLTAKHAARALRPHGGSITLAGSPCGMTGKCGGETAYSASKAGVHGLVRVMAADLATAGVRVNCVLPGFVATPMNAAVLADPVRHAAVLAGIPIGRAAAPSEIAPLFVWLASDAASYVTGGFFAADGGLMAV